MRAGNDTAWRHRLLFMLAKFAPWLLPLPLTIASEILRRYPARFLAGMAAALSDSDQAILARPEIKFMLKQDASEAYRQGTAGAIQEITTLSQPWKFTPQDIIVEVKLWHGERDNIVPVRVGNYMSQALPHCQATFIAGGGHFLIIGYWRQILATLITFPEFRRIDGYEPGK